MRKGERFKKRNREAKTGRVETRIGGREELLRIGRGTRKREKNEERNKKGGRTEGE